jgi:acyl carrier protein
MNTEDPLRQLLLEFFELPPDTPPEHISQQAVKQWDSFAMMQLITELQGMYSVQFDLDELDRLSDYAQIRAALVRKGVSL